MPVSGPVLSSLSHVDADDFLHGKTAVLAVMVSFRPNPQVPYRYLDNRHNKPLQPFPDQVNAQHPPNDLSPDHSGHLLTMIGVRQNIRPIRSRVVTQHH